MAVFLYSTGAVTKSTGGANTTTINVTLINRTLATQSARVLVYDATLGSAKTAISNQAFSINANTAIAAAAVNVGATTGAFEVEVRFADPHMTTRIALDGALSGVTGVVGQYLSPGDLFQDSDPSGTP